MSINDPSNKSMHLFSYKETKSAVFKKDVNVTQGQKWSTLKGNNNTLNSIFDMVDKKYGNGDGLIQSNEVNILNKIVQYIDNMSKDTSNNGVLEHKELQYFNKKILSKDKLDEIVNKEDNNSNAGKPWSEGLDRNISKIKISDSATNAEYLPEVYNKLVEIGEQEGFTVEKVNSGNNPWIEDSSIRRADGKIYNQLHAAGNMKDSKKYTSALNTVIGQGSINKYGYNFDVEAPMKDVKFGETYLEGGNVLNTCKKDGSAGAIIGDGSIAATLELMKLEPTEGNIKLVKSKMANDLGLKEEDVVYIPQYDFHIDMLYRPLHNGEVAIPDFDEAIKILEETDIKNMKPAEKEERISYLKKIAQSSKADRQEAEKRLQEAGYKLVKIPNFTIGRSDETNFMNGVGGTSSKTGKSFYITNESEYPELENVISKYFKKAGIDNVYFVPTKDALGRMGGIDCLTQEE